MDGNDKCGAKEAAPQPRRRAGTPRCAAGAEESLGFCGLLLSFHGQSDFFDGACFCRAQKRRPEEERSEFPWIATSGFNS